MALSFSLRENPFYVLRLPVTAGISEVTQAAESRALDGDLPDAAIQSARQVLVTPRLRAQAELGWIPELSDVEARHLATSLERGDRGGLLAAIGSGAPLAEANILAHLLAAGQGVEDDLHRLERAWAALSRPDLQGLMEQYRKVANLPPITEAAFEDALSALRQAHSKAASQWVRSTPDPGKTLCGILSGRKEGGPSALLRSIVQDYDAASEAGLSAIREEIARADEAARLHPEESLVRAWEIASALARWDRISQPVQVWSQSIGREEPRSREIAEQVRGLALTLANEHDRYDAATVLTDALIKTFPELESFAQMLAKDREALRKLTGESAKAKLLEDLDAACKAARTDIGTLRADLGEVDFAHAKTGQMGRLLEAFRRTQQDPGVATLGLGLMRNFSLYLNNERREPRLGFFLLRGVLGLASRHVTPDMRRRVEGDVAILYRNWTSEVLDPLTGRPGEALDAIERLLAYAPAGQRGELEALARQVRRKRLGGRVRAAFWTAVAGVGVIAVVASNDAATPRSTGSAAPRPVTASVFDEVPDTLDAAVRPPQGQGRNLSYTQVLYCVVEDRRLDLMYDMVTTNYEIDRFNALVDDYNSRCASYRYISGDLTRAQRAASEQAAEIRRLAAAQVASW